ncbi:hypothetical protein GCM10020000_82640 [Streptomyces olivoverticillatus]
MVPAGRRHGTAIRAEGQGDQVIGDSGQPHGVGGAKGAEQAVAGLGVGCEPVRAKADLDGQGGVRPADGRGLGGGLADDGHVALGGDGALGVDGVRHGRGGQHQQHGEQGDQTAQPQGAAAGGGLLGVLRGEAGGEEVALPGAERRVVGAAQSRARASRVPR